MRPVERSLVLVVLGVALGFLVTVVAILGAVVALGWLAARALRRPVGAGVRGEVRKLRLVPPQPGVRGD